MAGKLSRLVIHPVSNFVVAAGFARLEGERLASSIQEMTKLVSRCLSKSHVVKSGPTKLVTELQRIGPITAMVDRVAKLGVEESAVVQVSTIWPTHLQYACLGIAVR